jgi:hypothetical protein
MTGTMRTDLSHGDDGRIRELSGEQLRATVALT